jgi:hypothetical protein
MSSFSPGAAATIALCKVMHHACIGVNPSVSKVSGHPQILDVQCPGPPGKSAPMTTRLLYEIMK